MKGYRLRDLLFSTVIFEAEGGNCERFLSGCMQRFVPLSEVQATPYGFRARLPAGRYRQLHLPARAAGCRLHVIKKQGPGFYTRPLRRHSGVLAGLLAVALLTALTPSLVWRLEYYGLDTDARQELSDRLFDCGICQGSFVTDEALRGAEQQILMDSDRFAALSLNFAKGKLVVEAELVTPDPPMFQTRDRDILASENGVVRSVEVFSGVAAVQAGQTVQKGDVLVSANWVDQTGALRPAPCRARIMAYIEKTCTTACPLVQQTQVVTGTCTDSLALCFGPWRLWLKKGQDPGAVPAQQGVQFLGLSLPLTVYRTLGTVRQDQELHLTQEEARQRCVETLNALLYAQFPDMQVLSRSCSFETDGQAVYCTMQLRAYADIAAAAEEET